MGSSIAKEKDSIIISEKISSWLKNNEVFINQNKSSNLQNYNFYILI